MPTQLERAENSVNIIFYHLGNLLDRMRALEALPGGRDQMTPEQRAEYDIIGSAFSRIASRVHP